MVPDAVIKQLQSLCQQHPTQEVCGLIDSENEIYVVQNVARRPTRHREFVFDKREYLQALQHIKEVGRSVKAVFHSHPQGDCTPSKSDCAYILQSKTSALIVSNDSYHWIEYKE